MIIGAYMQAMPNVKDMSPLNTPATFNRHAAATVKAKVERLILVYVVILSTPDSRLRLTCHLHLFGASPGSVWCRAIVSHFV